MINIRLDYVLLDKRMKLKDLSEITGIAVNNLSILKTNKARAIRFSTSFSKLSYAFLSNSSAAFRSLMSFAKYQESNGLATYQNLPGLPNRP